MNYHSNQYTFQNCIVDKTYSMNYHYKMHVHTNNNETKGMPLGIDNNFKLSFLN